MDSTEASSTMKRSYESSPAPEVPELSAPVESVAESAGEPVAKKLKVEEPEAADPVSTPVPLEDQKSLLPPSAYLSFEYLALTPDQHTSKMTLSTKLTPPLEPDVGITQYISSAIPPFSGIIKQRFSDFMVWEINNENEVIRLNEIGQPTEPKLPETKEQIKAREEAEAKALEPQPEVKEEEVVSPVNEVEEAPFDDPFPDSDPLWPQSHTKALQALSLPLETITALRDLLIDGQAPKKTSDEGWAAVRANAQEREKKEKEETEKKAAEEEASLNIAESSTPLSGRGRGRDKDRGKRGGRGGRDGGRGGNSNFATPNQIVTNPDKREVLTPILVSKEGRTAVHKTIREVFEGRFETTAREINTKPAALTQVVAMSEEEQQSSGEKLASVAAPPSDQVVVIKWNPHWKPGGGGRGGRGGGRGGRGGGRGGGGDMRTPRPPQQPPYIHFTLQKTNRDTNDCMGYLSRILKCMPRDLSTAGTKDKRGVTTQRVCFKRNGKNLVETWRLINGMNGVAGRNKRGMREVLKERGERGVRVGDFGYSKKYLELGMLKGNEFLITLRGVIADSPEIMNAALESIKTKGFLNYYGMQRFGTSPIPTHAVGLAILQGNYDYAVELLMRYRPGEHPDGKAARAMWLEHQNIDIALSMMPKRNVAERSILEGFKRSVENGGKAGDDCLSAFNMIPRNLRLIYVHAYQSYLWNVMVSERARRFGTDKPIVGDLVFEKTADGEEVDEEEPAPKSGGKDWKTTRNAHTIKVLTEADLANYTMFDVVIPLPGYEVNHPTGELGEAYVEILKADGLSAEKSIWNTEALRDYNLAGSYRKMIHLPKSLSWTSIRYTDPEVALSQSDEDKILELPPPDLTLSEEEGKFLAVQIRLQLGTSAYATMALREVTKTETSAAFQTVLTQNNADQKFAGTEAKEEEIVVEGEGETEDALMDDSEDVAAASTAA